ncbi:hypothetical protein HK101_006855 [Irineochytrium annulatum]|nr:hypothetical protein HK101_006855 [Irineochytrium annulatum]
MRPDDLPTGGVRRLVMDFDKQNTSPTSSIDSLPVRSAPKARSDEEPKTPPVPPPSKSVISPRFPTRDYSSPSMLSSSAPPNTTALKDGGPSVPMSPRERDPPPPISQLRRPPRHSISVGNNLAREVKIANRRSMSLADDPFADDQHISHNRPRSPPSYEEPDFTQEDSVSGSGATTPPNGSTASVSTSTSSQLYQSNSLPTLLKSKTGRGAFGSQPILNLGELADSRSGSSVKLSNPFDGSQDIPQSPSSSFLAPRIPVPTRDQSLAVGGPPLPPRPMSPAAPTGVSEPQPGSPGPVRPPPLPNRPVMVPPAGRGTDTPPPLSARPAGRIAAAEKDKLIIPVVSANINRRPPQAEGLFNWDIYHKGAVRCFALSGYNACTAGHQNLRIYYIPSGECRKTINFNDPKISAMCFAPGARLADEGKILWVGLEKGEIACINVDTSAVIDRRSIHMGTVTHMLRDRTSLWTLDENGHLKQWLPDQSGNILLSSKPRNLKIGSRQERAVICAGRLWTAAGKTIEVYNPNDTNEKATIFQQKCEAAGAGNVASLVAHPDGSVVYSGHDDGKIVVWDSTTCAKRATVSSSFYKVTAMLCIGDSHLWVGTWTGRIVVYDTANQWKVIKDFTAHQSAPVAEMWVDEKIFLQGGKLTVASLSSDGGHIKFWDGLLQRDWTDNYMKSVEHNFCTYRDINVFVGSWNVDANKPDVLDGRPPFDNALFQWFSMVGKKPPEIIVINLQEIVDLESKKVNAKKMLLEATTKHHAKAPVDHRFQAWQERIQKVLRAELGSVYRLLECQQLVGLFQCIFILEDEAKRCKNVASAQVKTGLGGFHGNKVSARNNDAVSIRDSMQFTPPPHGLEDFFVPGGDGSIILDHENVIICGDLNYRIDLPREQVITAIEQQNWRVLVEADQLTRQHIVNPAFGFRGFSEGPLNFAPTFKYDINSQNYDSSDKKRVPSWCDRILWRGNLNQTSYGRTESTISDHRPIHAAFRAPLKKINFLQREDLSVKAQAMLKEHYLATLERERVKWLAMMCNVDRAAAERQLSASGDFATAQDVLMRGGGGYSG